MKKRNIKMVGGAVLAVVAIAIFAQVWVSAQRLGGSEQGLIGSWDVQVTIRNCQDGTPLFGFPSHATFNQGGTMQEADLGPPVVTSLPSHGVWSHTIGQEYSAAFRRLTFAPDRSFIGTGVVRSSIVLERGGDTFTSTDTFAMYDANGDVIPGSQACATEVGTRFR